MFSWRLDLWLQKVCIILMTSSINLWRYSKNENSDPDLIGQLKFVFGHFFCIWTLKARDLLIDFHRKLWEGQEIDRRSKMKTQTHFQSFDRNFSFNESYHFTWTSWGICKFYFVYRLMSHVIKPFKSWKLELQNKNLRFC